MNVIEAYEKLREGYNVINKDIYNLKDYDYLEWNLYMRCICAFKFGSNHPISNDVSMSIEDIQNCNWIIVE